MIKAASPYLPWCDLGIIFPPVRPFSAPSCDLGDGRFLEYLPIRPHAGLFGLSLIELVGRFGQKRRAGLLAEAASPDR
jgi:hypothetical protein